MPGSDAAPPEARDSEGDRLDSLAADAGAGDAAGMPAAERDTATRGGDGGGAAADASLVAVVDDDCPFARSLCDLLDLHGFDTRAFGSATDFMADPEIGRIDVVLLDIFMPGVDGLSTQRRLAQRDLDLPIVVITGSSEVDVAVRAMKQGAVDYLVKPFEPDALIEKVRSAAHDGAERRRARVLRHELTASLQELTPREREVLERLIGGQSSKVIARELDMSPRTVDTHRTRILRKFEVETTLMLMNRFADSRLEPAYLREDPGE